jgi:hypothetical protein
MVDDFFPAIPYVGGPIAVRFFESFSVFGYFSESSLVLLGVYRQSRRLY